MGIKIHAQDDYYSAYGDAVGRWVFSWCVRLLKMFVSCQKT